MHDKGGCFTAREQRYFRAFLKQPGYVELVEQKLLIGVDHSYPFGFAGGPWTICLLD